MFHLKFSLLYSWILDDFVFYLNSVAATKENNIIPSLNPISKSPLFQFQTNMHQTCLLQARSNSKVYSNHFGMQSCKTKNFKVQ